MTEKKRSLNAALNFTDFGEIDDTIKKEIQKFFPVYYSDDEDVMKEECEECIRELSNLMYKYRENERVQNYIVAKVTIVRNQCPFEKISKIYHFFLTELKEKYPNLDYIDKPRYTAYFLNQDFASLRNICKALSENDPIPEVLLKEKLSNERLFDLLKDMFNFYHGRLPRAEQILLWYPDYLAHFFELQRVIMLEDGPIPLDWRYFLALISVSCYGCDYLYNILLEGFVEAGGDTTWLCESSKTLPVKLKNLIDINYELAYKPWILLKEKQEQFDSLLKGNDAWSRQELMEVLIIFSFYHSFCCYVYAMGILPEFDFPRDFQKDLYIRADDETWKVMLQSSLTRISNQALLDELNKLAEKGEEEEKTDKVNEKKNSIDLTPVAQGDESIDLDDLTPEVCKNNEIFELFFGDRKVHFETYMTKQKKIDSGIYEWKIHGRSYLEEYFPEIAKLIDTKYDYVRNLTLKSYGDKLDVNTEPFRKSIIKYIELIYGYVHQDFDYKKMNSLLHKDIKLAAKTIGSTPQNLSFPIMNKFPLEFATYEICHIALLIMEAKFQIELMYGILALQNAKG